VKKFPEMTEDRTERLFAPKILARFPYYAEFWQKFIGVRLDSVGRLLPYRLEIPDTSRDRRKIVTCHEKLSMRHYSQFCHLAGSHYQLEQAAKAPTMEDEAMRHFLFWEAFDNFYQHLCGAREQIYSLWVLLRRLNENLPKGLKSYFTGKGNEALWQRIAKWDDEVITVRNNIVHFSRIGAPFGHGTYWIPLPIRKDQLWSDTMPQPKQIQEVTKKMAADLDELELLLDQVLRFFGDELEKAFQSMGVSICYE
jgi:hypothetical protein